MFQEGKTLHKLIAGSGKSLTMELSGKSLMIVFENSDLDSVVEGVVDGIWTSQGQVETTKMLKLLKIDVLGGVCLQR